MNTQNNQQNSSSLPRENTAAGKLFTRRNFLKLAGASALALPFLRPEEAYATASTLSFHAGCSWNATGLDTAVCKTGYKAAGIPISGVHGYGANPGGVPTDWGNRVGNCQKCLTIYPVYGRLMNGEYDSALTTLFGNAHDGDMLTAYQEPENIAHWSRKYDANHKLTIPILIRGAASRAVQNHLLLIKQRGNFTKPMVGAIGFKPWKEARDSMAFGLDFYALDVYETEFHTPGDCENALKAYREGVPRDKTFGTYRPISVCECNAHGPQYRAKLFHTVGSWVRYQSSDKNNPQGILHSGNNPEGHSIHRGFYTFWNWGKNASSGGPWIPASQDHDGVINALKYVAGL